MARHERSWRAIVFVADDCRSRGVEVTISSSQQDLGDRPMKTTVAAAAFVALVAALPAPQAQAQDVLGGALLGGAAGAIIGGAATGRAGGAAVGAAIGATTGALIANEAERRRSGYYWWKGNCYFKKGGDWYRVKRRYCN
jgi:hypothetical protein